MGSIFDFDPKNKPGKDPNEPEPKQKRSKHREGLTPAEAAQGKRRLSTMVEKAFDALEEAVMKAEYATSIKAAQILLDRAGFGPKATMDLNHTHRDLSELSKQELAERASKLSNHLRKQAGIPEAPTPVVTPAPTSVN